ncbi:MAG: toxic anion resistance protein, partial [Deltaproteobacteria bacterium]|nr:toxic anion resistance protein [Deltaproteobacteria bacterium]
MDEDLFSLDAAPKTTTKTAGETTDDSRKSPAKTADAPIQLTPAQKEKADALLALVATEAPPDPATVEQAADDFGREAMKSLARRSGTLAASVATLAAGAAEDGSASRNLGKLRDVLAKLDPAKVNFLSKGFFGFFVPGKRYFKRQKSREADIAEIAKSLDRDRDGLKNDNVTLGIWEKQLKEAEAKLKEDALTLDFVRGKAEEKHEALKKEKGPEDDRTKRTGEILFDLNRRLTDIQQTLTVARQGLLAMEIIRKNNLELARGIDRARTVTMIALRISVAVAGALYNQKLTLKKLDALNSAVEDNLRDTSSSLRDPGLSGARCPASVEAQIGR